MGNLRIDGLYFDGVTNQAAPPLRIFRNAATHVGIAAQGYPFAAPTGVVEYRLRSRGAAAVVSTLNGYGASGGAAAGSAAPGGGGGGGEAALICAGG